MKARINQIGIITSNFEKMLSFYRDILGFKVKFLSKDHVEFENEGVRFAMSSNTIMFDITQHENFNGQRKGQGFELAFLVDSPDDVIRTYDKLVAKGATPIKKARDMNWGQRTAFFADPDGNVHEIFADLPEDDNESRLP